MRDRDAARVMALVVLVGLLLAAVYLVVWGLGLWIVNVL